MSDWSSALSDGNYAALDSNTGNGDYPAGPNGIASSDALGIFNNITGSVLNVAKTWQDFQTQALANSTNAAIAQNNIKTQQTLSQIQAQTALAKAQAALSGNGGSLMLIIAVVGLGLAWMQYAKK